MSGTPDDGYKYLNEYGGVKVGDRVAVEPSSDLRLMGVVVWIREDHFVKCRWDDIPWNGKMRGQETIEHSAMLELL